MLLDKDYIKKERVFTNAVKNSEDSCAIITEFVDNIINKAFLNENIDIDSPETLELKTAIRSTAIQSDLREGWLIGQTNQKEASATSIYEAAILTGKANGTSDPAECIHEWFNSNREDLILTEDCTKVQLPVAFNYGFLVDKHETLTKEVNSILESISYADKEQLRETLTNLLLVDQAISLLG